MLAKRKGLVKGDNNLLKLNDVRNQQKFVVAHALSELPVNVLESTCRRLLVYLIASTKK